MRCYYCGCDTELMIKTYLGVVCLPCACLHQPTEVKRYTSISHEWLTIIPFGPADKFSTFFAERLKPVQGAKHV